MKKVLAVVIAVAVISIGAVSSNAQVPNIGIYFDTALQEQQGDCGDHFVGHVDSLNVVMLNFNAFVTAVEFATDFGANFPVSYVNDLQIPAATLSLGQSYVDGPGGADDGIAITYQIPQNAYDPFVCMKLLVIWNCDSCDGTPLQSIAVVEHETFNDILALEFLTNRQIFGVGMTSLVCPVGVANEESSWGKVKALYGSE
jgi:hypothetical protein